MIFLCKSNQLNSKLPYDSDISYSEQTQILIDSTSSFTVLILLSILGLYLLMFARFNDSILLSFFILVGGIPAASSVGIIKLIFFSRGVKYIYATITYHISRINLSIVCCYVVQCIRKDKEL